jgi:hypothetical protein
MLPRLIRFVACLLMASVGSNASAVPEPLAHYPLAEGSAETTPDVRGGPALQLPPGAKIAGEAWRGTALRFSGSSTIALPESIGSKLAAFTVTFWIKPSSAALDPSWHPILELPGPPKERLAVHWRWGRFMVRIGNAWDDQKNKAPDRDWWSHCAIVRNAEAVEMFVNGKSVARQPVEVPFENLAGSPTLFAGALDAEVGSIRVYDRALEAAEVLAIFNDETPKPGPGAAAPAPNVAGQSIAELAAHSRYTPDEIRRCFPPIQSWGDFGVAVAPDAMAGSFAKDRFAPPPAPGVHPRVYFGPDDLPRLREQLAKRHIGRTQMGAIRGMLLQLAPEAETWERLGGPGSEALIADLKSRGILANRRMGFHGPWLGGWVNALAAGEVPPDMEAAWDASWSGNNRRYLMHLMPFEAFRCLLDQDAAGGKRLAAAFATLVRRYDRNRATYAATDNWQQVCWPLGADSIGLTYDWIHPFMDDAQRADVRAFIAAVTRGKSFIGLDQVPAVPGNTTNWIIMHANLLPMILSIEGEEGFDGLVYERLVEGLRKWVYVASDADGAPFEGLNKSAYAPQWLIPLAKRGHPFIGSQWALNHVRQYLLHVMLPWGTQFAVETGLGGPGNMNPWKYAHPDDPVVDLIYGASVRELFNPDSPAPWVNHRTTYAPWFPFMIFADDPAGAEGGRYDFAAAADRRFAELAKSEPLSWWSDFYGCLSARTAWHRDAHHFYFESRNMPGGHSRDDRGQFTYAALGRAWATRTSTSSESHSDAASVILIDGRGQGHHCPPGRAAALSQSASADFAAADSTWAYSKALSTHATSTPIDVTPNDSRIRKSGLPWMSQPWSFLPGWSNGRRGGDRHSRWIDHNPVRYAFRSAGLVRAANPQSGHAYVLVADDVRKDDDAHDYLWQLQLASDLELLEKRVAPRGAGHAADFVFGTPGDPRRLLVRLLQAGGTEAESAACVSGAQLETYEFAKTTRNEAPGKRLLFPLRSVTCTFRTLLWAHREGDPLPRTTWNEGRTQLAVEWSGQNDRFTLEPNPDGRTRLTLRRGDAEIAALR